MFASNDCDFVSAVFNLIPYYFCLLLSILIFLSPIDPTRAAEDFTAYRLTQFDFQDSSFGSRVSPLFCEIQSTSLKAYARRCPVMKLAEVSVDVIRNAIKNSAAGIIIILPSNSWTNELRLHWHHFESELLTEEFQLPIYFLLENDNFDKIYSDLEKIAHKSDQSSNSGLFDAVFTSGYRVHTNAISSVPLTKMDIINIEGRITSNQFDSKKQTIVLTAYYDADGAIPALAYGSDANAGGVAVLLETARIISQIFNEKNVPKYNILFLLTGGGKYNFLGSKRWLEHNLEDTAGLALLDSVAQVICLEGLGTNTDDQLRLHVSRMPKEGTLMHKFVSSMEIAAKVHPSPSPISKMTLNGSEIEVVHKKINLNQYELAWEHERYSLHRLSTATFSSWPTHNSYKYRHSSLDGGPLFGENYGTVRNLGPVKPEIIARNAKVLSEALIRIIYDMDSRMSEVNQFSFVDSSWSTKTTAGALMDLLTLRPRSFQFLSTASRSNSPPSSGLGVIQSLESYMRSFLPDVHITRHPLVKPATDSSSSSSYRTNPETDPEKSDSGEEANPSSVPNIAAARKDPVITFYSSVSPQTFTIYRLKSSIFDLVIACIVAAYLYGIHILLENFNLIVKLVEFITKTHGKKLKAY